MTDNDNDKSLDGYYERKQSMKRNRLGGEAEKAPPDRDAESSHYSYGQKGYGGPKGGGSSILDDEPWKDKS